MIRTVLAFSLMLLGACSSLQPQVVAPAAVVSDSTKWEPDIVAFEQQDAVVRRMPGGIVFVGSSSIRLWESLHDDFPGVPIVNRGFGGSRVRDSTWYADRIVTPYQPRAVVFYAGDNDLFEGRTPQQVRDDFEAFVDKVRASLPDVRIAFIAIKPSPSRATLLPQVREANALVREYAKGAGGVDYLDVFLPMLDAQGRPRPELFVDDQLHLNRSGYAIWAGVVRPWIAGL